METVSVLIAKAQAGDGQARDILIEENLGLVHHIVKRFAGRGYDMEDLFQTGTIGLMKAIDHFDLTYEVKFSTYAVPMILGEIRRFLRDDGMMKVSRSLKEANRRLQQAAAAFMTANGREATLQELCQAAQLSREEAVLAMGAAGEVESIYKTVYAGDGKEIQLLDKVSSAAWDGKWEDTEKEKLLDRMLLQQMLSALPPKEKQLIYLRYYEEKTQTQIAREMGISQVQVSRLEKRILVQMRKTVLEQA